MRDFRDPCTLSAELEGVSSLVAALWEQFDDNRVSMTNETIAQCLFAVELHLERIADDVCEIKEEPEHDET